jgi:hypothetical protein
MTDWYITDVAGSGLVSPQIDNVDGALSFQSGMIQSLNHDVYWMVPRQYVGNKVLVPSFNLILIKIIYRLIATLNVKSST